MLGKTLVNFNIKKNQKITRQNRVSIRETKIVSQHFKIVHASFHRQIRKQERQNDAHSKN